MLLQKGVETIFGDQEFLIIAEVSKIKERHTRYYIELVEYEWGKVIATSHGLITNPSVLFTPLRQRRLKLDELKWQQILMTCRVVFHKDYGYQLVVREISAEYTLGSIKKKEHTIKEELVKLWIYDLNKQKPLGLPPYKLAIISSSGSEWLRDFLGVLHWSNYRYTYTLFESAIHGNVANQEVHRTLQKIYEQLKHPEAIDEKAGFDLVVIVRWWGGTSGVMRYNDLNIAKGICYMPVPVMMAVGHTSDQYLLDDIACYSAKTPTDAAYLIVGRYDNLKAEIATIYDEIMRLVDDRIRLFTNTIESMRVTIDQSIQLRIESYRTNIESWYEYVCFSKPEKILQSGYALLQDTEWHYLHKEAVNSLSDGHEFVVVTHKKKLIVRVVGSSAHHEI